MSDLLRVSGKRFELPAPGDWGFEARPGGWIMAERKLADGKVERRRIFLLSRADRLGMSIDGRLYWGEVSPARSRHGAVEASAGGAADLVAQFPGKVRKLLCKEGQGVAAGEKLILVEAMKMEFAVQAPAAGRVKKILVKEGQQLSPGDRFIDFEEEPAEGEPGNGG